MGIKFFYECPECQGTGVRRFNTQAGPQVEDPCAHCSGTGKKDTNTGMHDELLLQMMAELEYIHGKVTAIWNQVKPGN